jgi:hypothetical protein
MEGAMQKGQKIEGETKNSYHCFKIKKPIPNTGQVFQGE